MNVKEALLARQHLKRYMASRAPQPQQTKVASGVIIPVQQSIVNTGNYTPEDHKRRTGQGKFSVGNTILGGRLNPRGIPTYPSGKYGTRNNPGVFSSGRRAKPTGFGSKVAQTNLAVGTRQILKPVRSSEKYW